MTAGSTEDRLLAAARELFRVHGYTGTHIRAITRVAGVSVSRFYTRFSSKEQAYRQAMGCDPEPDEGRPLAGRALRTREALIATARECFERDGYQAARISDIAERAGVAVGSFYTYFPSKLDVFTEVIRRAVEEQRRNPDRADTAEAAGERQGAGERLRRSIEHFFDRFTHTSILMLRIDEAISVHPELVPLRLSAHREFADRLERSLRKWRDRGLIDPQLDPAHTADALSSMVGHATRVWITYGQPHDRDTAVATLTRLFLNGLGLREAE